jgi:hypothetical protein
MRSPGECESEVENGATEETMGELGGGRSVKRGAKVTGEESSTGAVEAASVIGERVDFSPIPGSANPATVFPGLGGGK